MGLRGVREEVLGEHAELRGRLDEIEALVRHYERGTEAAAEELRERGLALYARFLAHIDLEDRILVAALRASGLEGARRADRLSREHEEQRELLDFLIARLGRRQPSVLVARELQSFVEYLREDMAHEERTLLTGELPSPGGPPLATSG